MSKAKSGQSSQTASEFFAGNGELDDSRLFLTRIIEIVPGVIYVRDLHKQRNIYANRSVSDALGYTQEEITALGSDFAKTVMHPEDFARIPDRTGKFETLDDGEAVEFEYRMRHRNGEWIWFLSRDSIFKRDDEGKPWQVIGTATDITSRKQFEEKLKDSEDRFQLAFAAVQSVIYDWNIVEDTITRSTELKNLVGFDNSEPGVATNAWYKSRVHPADAERAIKLVKDAIISGADRFEDEYRLLHKDGHYVWVRDSGVFLKDADDKTVRCVGSIRNIDFRKQTEEALQESKLRYQTLAQIAPYAIFVNLNDKIVFANEQCIALFGASGYDEIIGKSPLEFFHPDYHEIIKRRIAAMTENLQAAPTIEEKITRLDGTTVEVEVSSSAFLEKGERAILVALRDITERKEAEEKLRASEKFMRSTLDSLVLSVAIIDRDGVILNVNEAWIEFAKNNGYDNPGGGIGVNYLDVVRQAFDSGEHSAQFILEGIEAVLKRTKSKFEFEYPCHSPDELRWFLMNVSSLATTQGGAVISHINISERKAAEVKLRESQTFLARAQSVGQIGWWRLDTKLNELYWSDETYRIFGLESGTPLTYESFLACVHPEDRADVDRSWQAAVRGEEYDIEHRIIGGEQIKWVREKAYLEFDQNGELLGGFGIAQDITERKEAEQVLRESEERLNLALKGADLGTWDWNIQTGEVFFNERSAEIVGYTLEDLDPKNRTWDTLVHPEDQSQVTKLMTAHLEGKTPFYESVHRVRSKSGDYRWIQDRGRVFERDADGKPLRVAGTYLDITQSKIEEMNQKLLFRLSELIREAEDVNELFKSVVELLGERLSAARCLLNEVDLENQTATVRSEYRREDLSSFIGTHSLENYSELTGAEVEQGRTVIINNTETDERTAPWYQKTYQPEQIGAYIIVPLMRGKLWSATLWVSETDPRQWQDWEISLIETVGERAWLAAERIRNDRQIRESEERLRIAEEAAKGFNYEWNIETGKVTRSESIERVLGYRHNELATTWGAWTDLIHPDDRIVESEAEAFTFLRDLTDESFSGEYRIRHKNGHYVWLMERGTIIRDGDGNPLRVIGQTLDVTERKEQEETLRRKEMLEKLVLAQEDERKRLARDLHDEIGQQLTVLKFRLESFKTLFDDKKTLALIEEIQKQVKQIDDGIDFIAWELRPAALDDFGLFTALDRYIKEWSYYSGIPAELFNAGLKKARFPHEVEINLYRIAQEALHNVYKYAEAKSVEVILERRGDLVLLIIEDNGKGFDLEKELKENKGLGLTGMLERAALVGGNLVIETAPGAGTTIYVRLPASFIEKEENDDQ